jgi:hypothetical protein
MQSKRLSPTGSLLNGHKSESRFQILKGLILCFISNVFWVDPYELNKRFGDATKSLI